MSTFDILNDQIAMQILDCIEIQLEYSESTKKDADRDGVYKLRLYRIDNDKYAIQRFIWKRYIPKSLYEELIALAKPGDWLKPTITVKNHSEFWQKYWIDLDPNDNG